MATSDQATIDTARRTLAPIAHGCAIDTPSGSFVIGAVVVEPTYTAVRGPQPHPVEVTATGPYCGETCKITLGGHPLRDVVLTLAAELVRLRGRREG